MYVQEKQDKRCLDYTSYEYLVLSNIPQILEKNELLSLNWISTV